MWLPHLPMPESTSSDLDAVVVGCGPGPFTGLRVGMATAAAYGHALGIPVHGVCSLDAIGVGAAGDLWWSPMRAVARCTGRATATGCGSTARRSTRPADVPRRRHEALRAAAPVSDRGGSGAGVPIGPREPAPLVPLYLRRPDAKTLAERAAR